MSEGKGTKSVISWEEPAEFQELLRLRRLKRRSLWRNAAPLVVNTALIFALIFLFWGLYYRSDLQKLLQWQRILTALLLSFGISFLWRSFERTRKIEVTLETRDGQDFLSRRGDFNDQPLDAVQAYVVDTLTEGPYSCKVLIMKTPSGQRLVCLPNDKISRTLEHKLKNLSVPEGQLRKI